MVLVQMVVFQNSACNAKACLIIPRIFPLVKELNIPANADGTHKLDKNSFHIWPRGEYMLIALTYGSFTMYFVYAIYRRKFI
jgi:hypothetical protein